MYKSIISAIIALCPLLVCADVTLGFKGERSAQVGIYVKNINTGEVIASNDEFKALIPASVMKSVTAASVFSSISHDFKYQTKVYTTGSIKNGVCTGHLIIESCGDPTIDSENFKDNPSFASEILKALNDKGVKSLKGRIIVRQSLSDAGCIPEWEIDDVAWSYGAGLYGFNFRDNYFNLWPATKKTDPYVPDLNVKVLTGKSTDLIRGINSNNLTVICPKPTDKSWRISTTMDNPAESFKAELKKYLNNHNIEIQEGNADETGQKLLLVHESPALSEILAQMLIHSHNLYAEAMLRLLSTGSTRKQAIDREYRLWGDRGVSFAYNKILDGSGLARGDRLQPITISNVLEWMAKSEYSSEYVSLFPKVGVDGTVKSFLKDTPLVGKLALKTGSMNAVQCYAGYKLDDDAMPTHIVVILINSFYCDRGDLRKSIEQFILDTFKQ